ncbi:hypothetical protein LCGC14_2792210 [marine sediment metagenome]|uniref:Uncharacterized protein n=1 Tax=marine sediment metagenome TaxID=412755 RepID=A0A0F8ZCA1_9ZZZZ
MANAIFIDVNKVENLISKTIHYEIKAWDSYNLSDLSITEEEIPNTDLDSLKLCIENSQDFEKMLDIMAAIVEYESGVTINATYYDWDEIKHLFESE